MECRGDLRRKERFGANQMDDGERFDLVFHLENSHSGANAMSAIFKGTDSVTDHAYQTPSCKEAH